MKNTRSSFLSYICIDCFDFYSCLTSFYDETMIKTLRTIILCLSLLLLASCFWGGNWSSWDWGAWLSWYKWDWFTVDIPASWEILNDSSWVLPSPSSGKIALAVSSPDVKSWFSNNLLVLEEATDVWTSSEEFSKVTHTSSKEDYYFYNRKWEKSISFSDESSSLLYVFEARYNKNTPNLQFLQTGRICGDKTYLITIAVGTLWNSAKYENILKTFECK